MAEAFLRADEEVGRYEEGIKAARGGEDARLELGLESQSQSQEACKGKGAADADIEMEAEDEPQSMDDVTAVLDNLDDFLESWDLDAELAKANKERKKEMESQPGTISTVRIAGAVGLMDVGVWD